jgi:delta-aminolevulinic acid dehydratase/porphobilinogen synthase
MSSYPALRMRRLRRHDWTRRLVAENTLSPADFIWPVFVIEGENKREAISSRAFRMRWGCILASPESASVWATLWRRV